MLKTYGVVFLCLLALSGCHDSRDEINIDYSDLKMSVLKDASLSQPSNQLLDTYIKNGIRLRFTQQSYPGDVTQSDNAPESGTTNSNYSTTNVHEIGVDEADRLKYDGEYLYQVSEFLYESGAANGIRILKTNPENATAELVAEIPNNSNDLYFSDIFVRPQTNQLVSIKKTGYYAWNAILIDADWRWNNGKTEIEVFDIQNPESPSEQWKIEIEGNLEGSRRIDNMLYLVTRYIPNITDLNYAATTDVERRANEVVILSTPISDLLPHFQINDGAIRALVSPEDCLVEEGTEDIEGYADVITLSAIDLDTQQVSDSICLNLNVQGIYSSTSGFYIGGSNNVSWFEWTSFTSVHKFKLNGSFIEYSASATLPGYLGWDDPSFRMSEYNDDLRIVTTDFNQSGPVHHLSILREDGSNQLKTISRLPNDVNPSPIGKPGEQIYSVRFTDKRAYIVTFEQIDPLYVIDVSKPEAPSIAGELEIPGFSNYLHALSDDWLLGIGKQVSNGTQQGVKVELYDIRDIASPTVKNTFVFGQSGSSTETAYDLRSLSLLKLDHQRMRLAIPMSIYQQASPSSFSQWQESGLFLFDIDTAGDNEMSLDFSGKMITESWSENQSYPLHSGIGRSKIHGDAVFYLHGNQIYSTLWGNWEQLNGPY